MPVIEVCETVLASVEETYELLCKPEIYGELFTGIDSIRLLEQFAHGAKTAWIIDVDGLKFSWDQLEEYRREEKTLYFKQIQGDMLKFEGLWSFTQLSEGTKVSIYLDFDPGIPMLTGLFHYILMKKVRDTLQHMLQGLKEYAEHSCIVGGIPYFKVLPQETLLEERQL